jgi:hypothetical protein
MAVVAALVQQQRSTKPVAAVVARQVLALLEFRGRAALAVAAAVADLMVEAAGPTVLARLAVVLAAVVADGVLVRGREVCLLMAAAAAALETPLLAWVALRSMAAAAVVVAATPWCPQAVHHHTVALAAQALQRLQAPEPPLLAAAAAGLPLALVLAAKFVSGSIAKGLTNVSVRS